VTLAQFCSLMKNIFSYLQYLHQKPQRIANCAQLQQPRRKTSRWNASTCDQL